MTGTDTLDRVLQALRERAREMAQGHPSAESVQLGERIGARFEQNLSATAACERRAQLDDPAAIETGADKLAKALAYVGADEDEDVVRLAAAILARIPADPPASIRQVNKSRLRFGDNATITGSFNQTATTGVSAPGRKS